jgi:predicted aconitase with swiveling domain
MELRGRTINKGNIEGEAIVLENPFSLTGDFDPDSGTLIIKDHPLFGQKIANKILVVPTGKGAVNAAIVLYKAQKKGNAPIGILCRKADPVTVECAITVDIPMIDSFDRDPVTEIKTGNKLKILGEEGIVIVHD